MAVSAAAASVIIRNSTIEARYPGGLASFSASCPNQTFCTDGTVSRVGFMTTIDAQTFIRQLVAVGFAPTLEEAHSEIALVAQGEGFIYPCAWLQIGLFDGHHCAWLANTDRGNLFIPRSEQNSDIVTLSSEEFRKKYELIGLRDNGRVEVYRHRENGEIRYVGRPYPPVLRKWWQFWKKRMQFSVDGQNHDQIFETAWNLIKPYIGYQLSDAPVGNAGRKQLRQAIEMFNHILQFNPGNWAALWGIGIAYKCLHELEAAYTAFQRTYALERENPNVGRELAGICIALGKGEEAVRISREVMDRNPNDAGLASNHALALLIAGRVNEAEAAVEHAMSLEPEDPITRNLAKAINSVRANRMARPNRWP